MVKTILMYIVSLVVCLTPLAYAKVELKPESSQKLIMSLGSGLHKIDPGFATGIPEFNVMRNILEGLVSIDPITLEVVPGVAKKWEVSPDLLTYTFHLRKNAKWSDGLPVTAQDFVYSASRMFDPKNAAQQAVFFYMIKNSRDINGGKTKDLSKLGVKAIDSMTLQISLEKVTPNFLVKMADVSFMPVPRHIVRVHRENWTKKENFVGNGPFLIKEWNFNQHMILSKNPNYWDKEKVVLEEVKFEFIEDLNTEENTFRAGGLDISYSLPDLKIPVYRKKARANPTQYSPLKETMVDCTYWYGFNLKSKPLADVRVRKAMALAIDRSLIARTVLNAEHIPSGSLLPAGIGGYQPNSSLPLTASNETKALARKLLSEAGYPNGKGFPKLTIIYNTLENHKKIALVIQQFWKKTLGIDVELQNLEWKVYLNRLQEKDFQIARQGGCAQSGDPSDLLLWFKGGNRRNFHNWANEKYDRFVELGMHEIDPGKRLQYFQSAEKILSNEIPIVPIFRYVDASLVKESVVIRNAKTMNFIPWQGNAYKEYRLKYYALKK